ncbi:MAG: alpha/beta fold hydrolase [Piscinibacter sp.]|nr:alpha/beta fold hydrolase [Piscinibacter sp.]
MPFTAEPSFDDDLPRVVALHSSGAGGRQWDAWRRLPLRARWSTPDLLGYGGDVAWPVDAGTTLDAEAQRLADLLSAAPRGVHLVGHSYGGTVALQLALRWPQHVRSLTLYEPVRFALLRDGDAGLWRDIVGVGREIGAQTLAGHAATAAHRFVDYWSGPGAWAGLPRARQDAVAARMGKVRAEFEALFDDAVPASAYRQLGMPVRVLCGTRSPLPALRVCVRLVQACPAARLVRLDGLGHLGPIEAPARVAAQLALPLTHWAQAA